MDEEVVMPQQSGYEYPIYPQAQQEVIDMDLVTKTNPKVLTDEIEHKLKGEVYDAQHEKWIKKPYSRPFMNEEGIWRIMSIITSMINQNTILSNLTENEIRNLILQLGEEVIDLLAMKHKEFEVDKGDLTPIVDMVTRMAYIALKRGFNEGERKFLKTTVRSSEIIRASPNSGGGAFSAPERRGFNFPKLWK